MAERDLLFEFYFLEFAFALMEIFDWFWFVDCLGASCFAFKIWLGNVLNFAP